MGDVNYFEWISYICNSKYWNSDDNLLQIHFLEIKNEKYELILQ